MTRRTLLSIAASVAVLAGLMPSAHSQNLVVNGDFGTGDLTAWTSTANRTVTITYDAATGNPAGSALLARHDTDSSDNGNYLYQIVPVVNGAQYQLSAEWKGDLLNGGTGRNWAEVYINFLPDTTFVPGSIIYKKATDGGPNDSPMPWDWQDITASPNDSSSPADGIFTATDNYMSIAFNLGGRDVTRNNTQPGYYYVDNVSLTLVPEPSSFALLVLAGLGLLVRRFRR